MTTGATIFSGGEGVGVGMRQAGIEHLWGVEWDDTISRVARDNGFNTITEDVREVNIGKLDRPDILHASPVCKNASVAKTGGREAPEDVETAHATCRFIEKLHPNIFTLENVWGYRNFVAFRVIHDCLRQEGYNVNHWHLNAANYGVPQTRKRLILVAKLDSIALRPEPTHAKNPGGMFGLQKWVGWYDAIEDLISTLPESKFAQWQLDRLLDKYGARAFIVGGANTSETQAAPGVGVSEQGEPTRCVASNAGQWKAFIVTQDYGSPNTADERKLQIVDCDMPAAVVKSSATIGRWRAWLSQGRVVAMTPRCLARFQSFPDDYILPESNKLACIVIGNAVPPPLYQRIIEANMPERQNLPLDKKRLAGV